MSKQRLDKTIANQFNITRSEARAAIKRGLVSVNGAIIKEIALSVEPQSDKIIYSNKTLEYKEHIYIIMNKPRGVLSASTDTSRETVVDLVPSSLRRNGLFPVGRLDKDTTGLLIITDDGDFAHNVLSPKKEIVKTYIAELDGDITEEMVSIFKNGVVLADGTACKKALLSRIAPNKAKIAISEGKYHQIKRMFGTVGLGVNALHRSRLGGLALPSDLEAGKCRELKNDELKAVFLE